MLLLYSQLGPSYHEGLWGGRPHPAPPFGTAPHPAVWRHSLLSLLLSLLRSVGEFCWLPLSLLPEWRRRLLPLIRTLRYTCRNNNHTCSETDRKQQSA